jgi:hypothetical protein
MAKETEIRIGLPHGNGKQKFLHNKMKFQLNHRNKKARMTHQQKGGGGGKGTATEGRKL